MKKILFFSVTAFVIGLFTGLSVYLTRYFYPKQYVKNEVGEYVKVAAVPNQNTRSVHQSTAAQKEEASSENKQKKKTNGFIAKSFNGTIVILNGDGKTVYEYTDISIHLLPDDLQEEVIKGYRLKDDEALYNFLETYSS